MSTGSGGFQMGDDLRARVNQELPCLDGLVAETVFDASSEIARLRNSPGYQRPFVVTEYKLEVKVFLVEQQGKENSHDAIVKVNIGEQKLHEVEGGNGPVNAFDLALRKTLRSSYPEIGELVLCSYMPRLDDPEQHTAATTCVEIQAIFNDKKWFSTGRSTDIVEASAIALIDLYELYIHTQRAID